MENKINNSTPVLIPFSIDNDNEGSKHAIEEIRKIVFSGKIVILKNVFTEKKMIDLRDKIISWGNETPVFPHGESPSKYPKLNYHRIDDGTFPSVCPHLFHQYAFNEIEDLKQEYATPILTIANELTVIQNMIGRTFFNISETGLRLKVLQYPEGGGFLQQHTHPIKPQRIGLILSLSKQEIDFKTGSTVFETTDGIIDTLYSHDIGDIIIFRYDLPHKVTTVNQEKNLIDWSLPTGKWSAVLELRETHNLSHK